MITDRDIRDQVQQATDACEGTYDVPAITSAIVARYGLVDIESIDHDEFWAIVSEQCSPGLASIPSGGSDE